MLKFLIVIFIFSLILLGYPAWRIGGWLQLPTVWHITVTILLLSSQLIARMLLKNRHGQLAYLLRRIADFFFGLSPVLLGLVVLGEVVLQFSKISEPVVGLAICSIATLIAIWGVSIAWKPKVIVVPLTTDKISKPVRFVQISDVHIGSRTSRFLRQTMKQIADLEPDFLCITGDFIDQPGITEQQLASLAHYKQPIYYCNGNHERYEDHDQIMQRLSSLGVNVLRNQQLTVGELQFIGIDDANDPQQVDKILPTITVDQDRYSILLYHRPQGIEAAQALGVNLKISGHTHNGQIKPFNYAVKTHFEYIKGLYPYKGAYLYVNQGTGTWGPTLRLGTTSEITLFEITPTPS
jgi:predicted MPP superfamily phosphohydrolase